MSSKRFLVPLAATLLVAFAFGLLRLFELRFSAGDIYPPYSSLRADPLGAKVLYRSLAGLPGIETRRHYAPRFRMTADQTTAVLFLGTAKSEMSHRPRRWVEAVEAFLAAGGRVVFTMVPDGRRPGPDPGADPDPTSPQKPVDLTARWGFGWDHQPLTAQDDTAVRDADAATSLPPELALHSPLGLTDLENTWRPIYSRGDRPVIAERPFGRGTLVLCADSYPFSNEALWRHRQPGLLAWTVSNATRVVFDETHLGVFRAPGLSTLLRRYRLHGLFLGLAGFLGLFLWRRAVGFGPPPAAPSVGSAYTGGLGAASSLTNLLRRSIPPAELLAVCHREWLRTADAASSRAREQARGIQHIVATETNLSARRRDPVAAYRAVCRLLAERPRYRGETDPSETGTSPERSTPLHRRSNR